MAIFILADDLTGANDTAVQFAKRGIVTATVVGADPLAAPSSAEALAFSTESRGLGGEEAYRRLRALREALTPGPGGLVYKKVDSALRGNLGAELRAMLDGDGRARAILIAPALPASRRTTVGGFQLLDGVPVHETEMAADPVAPVRESHLPTLLLGQGLDRVGHLPLAEVAGGVQTAREGLRRLLGGGCRVVVADAATEEHLRILAAALREETGVVPCGTAGLAAALAEMTAGGAKMPAPAGGGSRYPRPFLAVVGSKSRVAAEQVGAALRLYPRLARLAVDPGELSAPGERHDRAVARAAAEAGRRLAGHGALVLTVLPDPAESGASAAPAAIAAGLGEIAGRVAAEVSLGALYLTGGDTVAAVCRGLAAQVLRIEGEPAPGMIESTVLGGAARGAIAVTKAGSFGDELSLARIVANVV